MWMPYPDYFVYSSGSDYVGFDAVVETRFTPLEIATSRTGLLGGRGLLYSFKVVMMDFRPTFVRGD